MVSTVGNPGEAAAATAEIKQDETSDARPAPQAQDPPQAMDIDTDTGKPETKIDVVAPKSSEPEGKSHAQPSDAMDLDNETSAHVEPAPAAELAPIAPITADPTNSNAQTRSAMAPVKSEPSAAVTLAPPKSNLEKFYAPYLLPEDTSLEDARARLRYALEQTRILRESFTEQVHERYGVVLKPVPTAKQHADQLEKLCANPHDAVVQLAAVEREKKKERERAKLEEGENDPLATFGGDGLHLVILPEEQPTLYKKGQAVSAASAAASDGLLDRVRMIRGLPVAVERTPRIVDRSLNSSPSLSVESSNLMVAPLQQQMQQKPRKSGYSSMLTLTPEGETLLKNKKYNATQMALLARGVGVAEMKRDPRVNSLVHHQRVVPKEFYETVLPPLLGARQVGRMEVRKIQARKAIRSVIREIMDKEEEDEKVLGKAKNDGVGLKKNGGNDKDGSGGGSSELGLLHRLHSISDKQNQSKDSDQAQSKSADSGGKSGESTAELAVDPLLAYSVMSAVGLVNAKKDEADEKQPGDKKDSGNSIAKTLGLSKLMNLGPVSDFVKSFTPIAKGIKRKQADDEDDQKAKKAKVDSTTAQGSDEVLHIRGGGGDEEEKDGADDKKKETSRPSVAAPANVNLTSTLQNQLLQQQSLYNMNAAMGGSIQSPLDAYQNAALAHQLGISIGSSLPSYQIGAHATPDLSEYILRSQLDRSLLLLREQQNVAAAVQYQAALSSLATQNQQYAAYASMHTPKQSGAGTSSSKAIDVDSVQSPQRKRSKSMEDNKSSPKRGKKAKGKSKVASPVTRPSSAPVQPARIALPKALNSKGPPLLPRVNEVKEAIPEVHFTPPEPPKGLSAEVAQHILDAKFHEAHALSQQSNDKLSTDLLIEFLLSLASAIPISQASVSEMVVKKLSKRPDLKEFAAESSFASDARKVIVATIIVCLWTKNESYYKQSCVDSQSSKTSNLQSNAVISFAVEKALHSLSVHCEVQSSMISTMQKSEIASIVNKSLARKVQLNKQMDATLPIMDDMLGLLDSLRVEALKAKVQERVLLATLVSTHGKMSEAFSNAYVSAIIRAGEALGHEDVCEIAQDETCRASTMLPYDFFHDHTGLWEEPCRPQLGVHPNSTGKDLKRRAHAKSVIQKSMKKLQDCLGLQGGISDGGPYFSKVQTGAASSSPSGTPTAKEAVLIRTASSTFKRKGSQNWDTTVMPGTGTVGVPDSIFNPGHWVEPMQWDNSSIENTPYGRHQFGLRPSIYSVGGSLSESKWKQLKQFPAALQNRSTHEVKWEDVASMFLHGGSTRNIVLDLGGESGTKKKNIVAPFVRSFDINSLNVEDEDDDEEFSDEDISDESILKRHQEVLDNMSKKITALTDKQAQSRGRKKQA